MMEAGDPIHDETTLKTDTIDNILLNLKMISLIKPQDKLYLEDGLIKIDTPLLIVAEIGREEEAISRLARVGYENVQGYLEGGFNTWSNSTKNIDSVVSITPVEFESRSNEDGKVLDVRKPGEFNESHVQSAIHVELSHLESNIINLDPSVKYYVYCRSGYRSMVAASILKANNVKNIVNIYDGINGIKETKEELVS